MRREFRLAAVAGSDTRKTSGLLRIDLLDEGDDGAPDLGTGDAHERLHQGEPIGRSKKVGDEIRHRFRRADAPRRGHVRYLVEEKRRLDAERRRNLLKTAGADP